MLDEWWASMSGSSRPTAGIDKFEHLGPVMPKKEPTLARLPWIYTVVFPELPTLRASPHGRPFAA